MPPRSVKMKRRILGFQRRVWWPKWTPASSSSRIETTDTVCPPCGWVSVQPAEGAGAPARDAGTATRPVHRDEGNGFAPDSSRTGAKGPREGPLGPRIPTKGDLGLQIRTGAVD